MKGKHKELQADLVLMFIAVIWGACFPMTKVALQAGMSSIQVMCAKFLLGAIVVSTIFHKHVREMQRKDIRIGLTVGVLLFGANYTGTLGLAYTSAFNSALITASYILLIPLFWFLMGTAKLDWRALVCAVGCFTGIAIANFDPMEGLRFGLGDLLALLSAVLFALQVVYIAHAVSTAAVQSLILLQMWTCSFLSAMITVLWAPVQASAIDWRSCALPMLYVGMLGTGLGYAVQVLAQKYTSPSKAGIIMALEGFWGAVFSIVWGLSKLSAPLVVGALLGVASIVSMEALRLKSNN